jgi:hypothetical protein
MFLLAVVAAATIASGCQRTVPVQNVADTPVYVPPGEEGRDVIREAIFAGGRAKGWRMSEPEPGHIVGTVDVREHSASVDILYDADSYRIDYKDSSNLMYDGSNIHRNYNKWVTLLDRQIQVNLPAG